MEDGEYHIQVQKQKWLKKLILFLVVLFIIIPLTLFFAYFFISGPAEKFPTNQVFEIKKGMSVAEIANFLAKENYIKSAGIFIYYDHYKKYFDSNYQGIKAGKYIFKTELDIFGVYNRLRGGISGIDDVKITILEGDPNFVIADKILASKKFKNFSKEKFLELAKDKEGYLYPDTYHFSPYATEESIIRVMEENFYKKNKKLIEKINKSNKSLQKIVIMASLIEKEAGNMPLETKQKIAGILWKRIERDMLLQVDAVFSYIFKRHLNRVLFSDLKVDSPYNTYKYKGLPPGPIGNPSTSSLQAAMFPIKSRYLYYINGKDGLIYYAETPAEHYQNIAKYRTNYVPPQVE